MSRARFDHDGQPLQPLDWWLKPVFIACSVAFVLICKYVP